MKRLLFACTASAITLLSATASAQVWLQDRRSTEGAGIRSGDIEFHPGIAAEVGYDSNYFQRPTNNAQFPVVDTVKLRLTPSFSVSTLGADRAGGAPPKFSFSAGAALIYSEYLTNAEPSATNTAALNRNRDFGVSADLALGIAPGRPVGFNILDNFTRTSQPSLSADGTAGLNRDENRIAGEFVYTRPGGLLDWRLGYAFANTYFEAGNVDYLNNVRHEIYTRGRWKFLPRTAIVYDGSAQFLSYTGSKKPLPDSTPLRTRIGIAGLMSEKLSLLAMVGWGASFYDGGKVDVGNFDSVIGQLELRYFLGGAAPEAGQPAQASSSSIAIGFTRDFINSYFTAFYERDRGYLSVSTLFAQRVMLTIDAGIAAIRYSAPLNTGGTTVALATNNGGAFTDMRADASVFLEYRVASWLGINATGQYIGEFSNRSLAAVQVSSPISLQFNRFQAMGGLRAFW
jgi:hypothetical protein